MSLPLSAHAREAVDRINARRQRERDLRVRRDTAIRARALNERLREIAERNQVLWDPKHNPARERYSTDSIPAQVVEYLHEHGESHTSRLALNLNRQYDAVLKALRRLEKNGDVACREEYGTRWWRLTYEEPAWDPPKQYVKLDREELVRFVDENPGVSVYEAARHFGAHQESVGRRFRELRDQGRLVDVVVDRSTPAQWFTPGAYMPPEDGRGVVRWDALVGFVRAHPGLTTREVAHGVGARPDTVRRALNKLSHSGRVRNRTAGTPVARWEAVG